MIMSKIFQKYYDDVYIEFNDPKYNQKMMDDFELNQQIIELKRIKKEIELINNRLSNTLKELHMAVVIMEKDKDGDYVLLEYNDKSKEIDKLEENHIGKKLIDVYGFVDMFGIFDVFDQVYNDGIPRKHQGYYSDDKIDGFRDSYIYRINDGIDEKEFNIVSIYEDVTYIKKIEKENRVYKQLKKYKYHVAFIIIILVHFF